MSTDDLMRYAEEITLEITEHIVESDIETDTKADEIAGFLREIWFNATIPTGESFLVQVKYRADGYASYMKINGETITGKQHRKFILGLARTAWQQYIRTIAPRFIVKPRWNVIE